LLRNPDSDSGFRSKTEPSRVWSGANEIEIPREEVDSAQSHEKGGFDPQTAMHGVRGD
jgi:hypothetical protein